jgi:hypothetical protein
MKVLKVLSIVSLVLMLSACGGVKNDTPIEAAQTFMKSMVEGDVELNSEVNHSDPFSFPPSHAIEIANNKDLVGRNIDEFTFEETDDEKVILVTWEDVEGETKDWKLRFNQEKEGYFFVDLD